MERTITQFTPSELETALTRVREVNRDTPKGADEAIDAWIARVLPEGERERIYWALRLHGYLRQLARIPGREVDLARIARIRVLGDGPHDATFDFVPLPAAR